MLRGMNWGCLTFLILFPAGIFIWAAGEKRRRDALPKDELQKLEDDEDYGDIDPELECIFCHSKNCVRTQKTTYYDGDPRNILSPDNLPKNVWRAGDCPEAIPIFMAINEMSKHEHYIRAHCMNCGNSWEMFPPKETTEQSGSKN